MDEAPVYNPFPKPRENSRPTRSRLTTSREIANGDAGARLFRVTFTSGGETITTKHFAAIQFDEVACPSYAGTATVAPSQYTGKPAGYPPAAYGYPDGQ